MQSIGARNIRDFMPDQHRAFFAMLPFVLLGAHDGSLVPRASILVGRPGFVRSPDAKTLRIDALPAEPLRDALAVGTPVGLLGIQLETRRRNRVNGTVASVDERGFVVQVEQSFGNCPQYIQARAPTFAGDPPDPPAILVPDGLRDDGPILAPDAAALVARADTFFIASAAHAAVRAPNGNEGLDISHRGGKPGFVRLGESAGHTVLTYPEFRGNYYFNTLGNIAQNPRTGMLFVDFEAGHCLSLAGEAEIVWDDAELEPFVGAQRFVRLHVRSALWMAHAVPLRWSAPEPARELAATGSWPSRKPANRNVT